MCSAALSHVFCCSVTCVPLFFHMCSAVLSHVFCCVPLFCSAVLSDVFRCSVTCVSLFCLMCYAVLSHVFRPLFCHMCSVRCPVTCVSSAVLSHVFRPLFCHRCSVRCSVTCVPSAVTCVPLFCHMHSAVLSFVFRHRFRAPWDHHVFSKACPTPSLH